MNIIAVALSSPQSSNNGGIFREINTLWMGKRLASAFGTEHCVGVSRKLKLVSG